MAHRNWCGKPCCDCQHPCSLDAQIPCSPDCENLKKDGSIEPYLCKDCDAYVAYMEVEHGH